MQLMEVTDKSLAEEFIQVNVLINRHDPSYIRPLDKDIHEVFDPKKNKTLRNASITRWILKNNSGQLIGRIAAFVNKKYRNKGDDVPVGGVGFFDCINSIEASEKLFDVAKHWLLQQGMQAMDGPINCGERDRWWGLLVEGFTPPPYCLNYNPPYYRQLFENYGFRKFYNQICYALNVKGRLQEKFYTRHETLSKNPDLRAIHIEKSQLEKFAVDFTTVYNKAWAGHGGLKELKKEQVIILFKQMKLIMDEKIVWFVYHKDEPVAVWANLPDVNQWFKYLDGKFNWWAKLKFLWIKKTKKCNKFTGLVFGIVPEWQAMGMDAFIIVEGAKVIQTQNLYEYYELQWIGEWNPVMLNVADSLGTHRSRKLTTYRYLFDRTKVFKEHPVLK